MPSSWCGSACPRSRSLSDADLDSLAAIAQGAFRRGEPMRKRTTLRIGGPADAWFEPATRDDLIAVLRAAAARAIPVTPVGAGSNLLVRDGGIAGLVVCPKALRRLERAGETGILVEAGVSTGKLLQLATESALGGVEFLGGVPGSVGGGLIMNAGTVLGEFVDVVHEVTSVRISDGELVVRDGAACGFAYRTSVLGRGEIVVDARLELKPRARAEIEADVRALKDRRAAREPKAVANAGSIFKNPPGLFAGKLIEETGLKGTRVGGAEISPVHANWIVNVGDARAADVLELVDTVRAAVVAKHGITLELEVKVIGRDT